MERNTESCLFFQRDNAHTNIMKKTLQGNIKKFSNNQCAVVMMEFLDAQVQKHCDWPQITTQSVLDMPISLAYEYFIFQNKLSFFRLWNSLIMTQLSRGSAVFLLSCSSASWFVFLNEHMFLKHVPSARLPSFYRNWTYPLSLICACSRAVRVVKVTWLISQNGCRWVLSHCPTAKCCSLSLCSVWLRSRITLKTFIRVCVFEGGMSACGPWCLPAARRVLLVWLTWLEATVNRMAEEMLQSRIRQN